MELLVLVAPLFLGPFVLGYGLVQLIIARLRESGEVLPIARVHTGQPAEHDESSWRQRGRKNLIVGALLCLGLVIVAMALMEAGKSTL